jgi:signal transduction histidine kinase
VNIYGTIPLISCLVYVVLIVITVQSTWRRARYSFIAYLGVAMIWSFSSLMLHANFFPQYTMQWHVVLLIALFSTWIIYYNFVRSFTNQKSMGVLLLAGYGVIVLFAVLTALGHVIESTYVADGMLYWKATSLLYLFNVPTGVLFFGLAAIMLMRHYRSTSDYVERNRTVYLLIGFSIMLLFLFSNVSSLLSRYPIDHFGNLVNAFFITYAIVKYRLLDIRVVIRRGLVYSVLTIGITATYLVLLFSLYTYFHAWTDYTALGAAAGLALIFAIVFQPLRDATQRWVDRLFYRGTYDYRQTLLTFSQRMSNVLDLDELAVNMLYPVTRALYAKRAFLLLPEVEDDDFATRFVQPATKGSDATMRLRRDNPIVAWLAREGEVLNRERIDVLPEFKSLWKTEIKELDTLELEIFCPIMRKGNLVGILALSKKHSDDPYSREDIDLLTTMTSEAAMVIENAMILDNLKEQQRRAEQLLAQTVQAQEDERKRISIELHDSVAQWLVGVSYQLQTCRALLSKSGNNSEAQNELAEIEATLDKSVKEMRRLMSGLHPPALDELGLVHALRQSLDGLKPDGIAYHLETTGEPVRLPGSTEVAIYRVVQEALTNVRKHSEASAVILRMQFDPENVSIEISDNGKGFNLSKTMRSAISVGHMGLLGMSERVTMLGGALRIETRPGAGTSIILTIPIASPTIESSLEADKRNI